MFTTCRIILNTRIVNLNSTFHLPKIVSLSKFSSIRSPVKFFRNRVKFSRFKTLKEKEESLENDVNDDADDLFTENNVDILINKTHLRTNSGHQVFVIQPYIKYGPQRKYNTTPDLQLLESITLIKTLREWKVVDKIKIGLQKFHKKTVFQKGNLISLKNVINESQYISAIFISINTLSLLQQTTLEEYFGVPVFDRYTIIINIFREHAKTKEAKLQIQMAELPYVWSVMKGMNYGIGEKFGGEGKNMGGQTPKCLSYRKEIFKIRQSKIKKEILELRKQREINRQLRQKNEHPVVAVIGYTNAGKTSLVQALTGKMSLKPQDYLFATLDVTCHIGQLPSGLTAYFVDTLGFINDIPTYLIESFVSTLEDAIFANLIIHVRDVSHPDTIAQNDNVLQTLETLNLPEKSLANIITVANKIDLLDDEELNSLSDRDLIMVSCKTLKGIQKLKEIIEKKVLSTSDKKKMIVKVKSGSEEYFWFHSESVIVAEAPDPQNNQYMFLNIIISPSVLSRFKHKFIKNFKAKIEGKQLKQS